VPSTVHIAALALNGSVQLINSGDQTSGTISVTSTRITGAGFYLSGCTALVIAPGSSVICTFGRNAVDSSETRFVFTGQYGGQVTVTVMN